jgi:hypothetical protein
VEQNDFVVDKQGEQLRLFTFFRTSAQLTGCLHSSISAFFPLSDEDHIPSWYEDITGHLDSLKQTAQQYLNAVAPQLTGLPQAYINFANVYLSGVSPIQANLEQLALAEGDERAGLAREVGNLIGQLAQEARTQSAAIASLSTTTVDALSMLASRVAAFGTGAHSITAALTEEQERVIALTNDIDALQKKIAKRYDELVERMKLDAGALQGAALGLPYAYGINRWTTGLTLFIMTGVITIAEEISRDTQIVDALDQIMQKQQELTADAADVFALNVLAVAFEQVQNIGQSGDLDLGKFAATLTAWANELTTMQQKIQSAQLTPDELPAMSSQCGSLKTELDTLFDYCVALQEAALEAVYVPLVLVTIRSKAEKGA